MHTILCVNDDPYLNDLLHFALDREGFETVQAKTGQDALLMVQRGRPHLAILDMSLRDTNGLHLLKSMRRYSDVPVVMLSARAGDEDVVSAFEAGIDDYVLKPASMQVLVSRVKAVLRRGLVQVVAVAPATCTVYVLDSVTLYAERGELVGNGGARVSLTVTETRILQLLCQHQGRVLSSERIMQYVWGYDTQSDVNVVKTHIRHLRTKLAQVQDEGELIRTLAGHGYVVGVPARQQGVPALHAVAV